MQLPANAAVVQVIGEWQKVIHAHDCFPCELCGEPVCPSCKVHYADCSCPGPTQDEEYAYKTIDGVEHARRLEDATV